MLPVACSPRIRERECNYRRVQGHESLAGRAELMRCMSHRGEEMAGCLWSAASSVAQDTGLPRCLLSHLVSLSGWLCSYLYTPIHTLPTPCAPNLVRPSNPLSFHPSILCTLFPSLFLFLSSLSLVSHELSYSLPHGSTSSIASMAMRCL